MALTKVGEQVLDLVIPYIHSVDDRNSVSLVSRKLYETDGFTRRRLIVHVHYYPNPASLSKRFPFIEALTLKGPPPDIYVTGEYDIQIKPWVEQLALEFRCLQELRIHRLVVLDEDLETLARTRGKDLRTLKIKRCKRYSTDGLRHVSKYCNQLRNFCLGSGPNINLSDGIWFHELAVNSTVLERLHVAEVRDAEDLTNLAKNCCNSLISLKIGRCYLSELGEAFRYAVRLEHFSGHNCDNESDLVGFQFPPNMRSLSITGLPATPDSIRLPFLNHIRKLKLVSSLKQNADCQCLLFKQCPNLEVLYTKDVCGDAGLQVIGNFCKTLRKFKHRGRVTHVGLIALAKGCINLESLDVFIDDISIEALECVGTHLKNLRHFRICKSNEFNMIDSPLDNGIQAMLMGCSKLERLDISHGGLTNVGLEYIGKYGVNLRSLSLTIIGNSNAGLVKLFEGCPRLRTLQLRDCPFRKQVVANCVFNIPSLRYVWGYNIDFTVFSLIRPEFQL